MVRQLELLRRRPRAMRYDGQQPEAVLSAMFIGWHALGWQCSSLVTIASQQTRQSGHVRHAPRVSFLSARGRDLLIDQVVDRGGPDLVEGAALRPRAGLAADCSSRRRERRAELHKRRQWRSML